MLCSRDFYNKSDYNAETKEQLWMSTLGDTHDLMCKCQHPFAHLLCIIFPIGHQDRNLTINQILLRDYKEKCRSGGLAGDGFGMATTIIKEEKDTTESQEKDGQEEEDVTDLLAAVAAAEEESR